jgi:hypothetical protein
MKRPEPMLPAEIRSLLPQAVLIGCGSLRFFGLSIYEARLWAAPEFDPAQYERQAFALELHYARRLGGVAIAERSIAEMRRGGPFSDQQARVWLNGLQAAFPDVSAGDRLTGVNDGQGGVRFFYNGAASPSGPAAQALEAVAAPGVDTGFARLFFGIWLAPTSSVPALRQALIAGARPLPFAETGATRPGR